MPGIIKYSIALIMTMVSAMQLSAQHSHDHDHGRNEIGVSGGAIYAFDHGVWGGGVHMHYFRTFGEHSKWSWGAMAEHAWAHGRHFTFGAGVKYMLAERLETALLPGITFLKHDDRDDHNHEGHTHSGRRTLFSMHVELVCDLIHWNGFHLGPAIDYSWADGDSHAMLGMHIAYGF